MFCCQNFTFLVIVNNISAVFSERSYATDSARQAGMDFPPSRGQPMQAQRRRAVLTLLVLLAIGGPLEGLAQPLQIFFGDSTHPVVSGEAWLIANRWGAYQGVLVATIQIGSLEARPSVQFPPYWEQAFDYKLLLAVADQPVGAPASLVTSSCLCEKPEGAVLPLFVKAIEDRKDNAIHAGRVDKTNHRSGPSPHLHKATFNDIGGAQLPP